jgi:hypothetical protein
MDIAKAKLRFQQHRYNAKARGIGFELTFEQWLAEWGDKIDQRGQGIDEYQMCRVMDRGPYAAGNVFIGTPKRNGHTRRIAYAKRLTDSLRTELQANPEPPYDSEWEDENPWLPTEFKPRNAWNWGHRN